MQKVPKNTVGILIGGIVDNYLNRNLLRGECKNIVGILIRIVGNYLNRNLRVI